MDDLIRGCDFSGVATVAAGLVAGAPTQTYLRMRRHGGFARRHAELMMFDDQRDGRKRVPVSAIRRFSWGKRPFILPTLAPYRTHVVPVDHAQHDIPFLVLATLLLALAACTSRGPTPLPLEPVAPCIEHTMARLMAELPLRAGGNAAGLMLGEAMGLFVAAGVTVWIAVSYEEDRPEIESQLREALDNGLNQMWQILMEDQKLGVLSPVRHMTTQIDSGLFPSDDFAPALPFR